MVLLVGLDDCRCMRGGGGSGVSGRLSSRLRGAGMSNAGSAGLNSLATAGTKSGVCGSAGTRSAIMNPPGSSRATVVTGDGTNGHFSADMLVLILPE